MASTWSVVFCCSFDQVVSWCDEDMIVHTNFGMDKNEDHETVIEKGTNMSIQPVRLNIHLIKDECFHSDIYRMDSILYIALCICISGE